MTFPFFIQRFFARDILAQNEFLVATLERIRDATLEIDRQLDDPHGDDSGNGARSPTGDDYNDLYGTVLPLVRDALAKIGIGE